MNTSSYQGLIVWQRAMELTVETYILTIARGSKAELETQLQIFLKIGYLSEQNISVAMSLLKEIGSMLTSLISKLKTEN